MGINEILAGGGIPPETVRKASGGTDVRKSPVPPDRVQVSGEARSLYEAERTRKLDEIRERLETGFYDRQDIIETIAREILKDLRNLPG